MNHHLYVFCRAFAACFLLATSACGGTQSLNNSPVALPATGGPQANAVGVSIAVFIPQSLGAVASRRRFWISPATLGLLVQSNAGGAASVAADLSPGSPLCQTTSGGRACTVSIPVPAGSRLFTFTTYDAAPVANSFGAAHPLGIATTTKTIVANTANTIDVTIAGIAASLSLSIAPNAVTAGTPNASIATSLNVLDADGNIIVGSYVDANGNPLTVTLSDPDTTGATAFTQTSFTQSTSSLALKYSGAHPVNSITFSAAAAGLNTATATLTIQQGKAVFDYTGAPQTFTVPAEITQITISAQGAPGGQGDSAPYGSGTPVSFGAGGDGALAIGTFTVTPGETTYVFVGGVGGAGAPTAGGAGGYNGGGNGGGGVGGGGGGGASDVRFNNMNLSSRMIVAGGGGGGGTVNTGSLNRQPAFNGGGGGAPNGSAGVSDVDAFGLQGLGATRSVPGAGGSNGGSSCPVGQTGQAAIGGQGSSCTLNATTDGGGGGGGGYFGGGGGGAMPGGSGSAGPWAAGGGGGSSFVSPGASHFSFTPDANAVSPLVTIIW